MQTPHLPLATPDPWYIAERLGLTIHDQHFNDARGYAYGPHDVFLCKTLDWYGRRCTLFHEVVHVAFGHVGHQDPITELHVRYTVARDLIPWPNLMHVARPGPAAAIARDLDVTPAVLRDRIDAATPTELRELRKARRRHKAA